MPTSVYLGPSVHPSLTVFLFSSKRKAETKVAGSIPAIAHFFLDESYRFFGSILTFPFILHSDVILASSAHFYQEFFLGLEVVSNRLFPSSKNLTFKTRLSAKLLL